MVLNRFAARQPRLDLQVRPLLDEFNGFQIVGVEHRDLKRIARFAIGNNVMIARDRLRNEREDLRIHLFRFEIDERDS